MPGPCRVDRARGCVFLHVHPILIEVDSQGILRHVGIVQAVAVDLLAASPLAKLLEVLLQAVGEHLCAFRQACRLAGNSRWAAGLAIVGLGLAALASDELIRLNLEQQQLARQGAVPEGILLVAADAHALAQLRRAGEHRCFPAHAGLAQALAKVLVEVQQAGFVTQALAVRGLLMTRPFWFWSGRGSKVLTSPW